MHGGCLHGIPAAGVRTGCAIHTHDKRNSPLWGGDMSPKTAKRQTEGMNKLVRSRQFLHRWGHVPTLQRVSWQ